MISTNELSFPMPAANLIAQRDPMRFVDTALYADDCAAESVTLVRADSLAADACGRFPAVALIEIMAQTIGIYAVGCSAWPASLPLWVCFSARAECRCPFLSSRRATSFSAEFKRNLKAMKDSGSLTAKSC